MLLVPFWVLVTSHCKLEALTGLEILVTCCDGESATASGSSCGDEVCDTVEFGSYKIQDNPILLDLPVAIILMEQCWLSANSIEELEPDLVADVESPPELEPCWQFITRAAALVRAPSITS